MREHDSKVQMELIASKFLQLNIKKEKYIPFKVKEEIKDEKVN